MKRQGGVLSLSRLAQTQEQEHKKKRKKDEDEDEDKLFSQRQSQELAMTKVVF
jgi:hypothetical protein